MLGQPLGAACLKAGYMVLWIVLATTENQIAASDSEGIKALRRNIDTNEGACNDFQMYSCGGFLKTAVIPPGLMGVGTFFELGLNHEKLVVELLEEPVKHNVKGSFEKKMKDFYKSCMNSDSNIDEMCTDFDVLKDWPTVNGGWSESSTNLQSLVTEYESKFTNVLFELRLLQDDFSNPQKFILEIRQPIMNPTKEVLANPNSTAVLDAYRKYYVGVATKFAANNETAKRDAADWMQFIKSIGEITIGTKDQFNHTLRYNPSTLDEMNKDFSYFDWIKLVGDVFEPMGITIDGGQEVSLNPRIYFEGLANVLSQTSSRTIHNAYGFMNALRVYEDTTQELRQVHLQLKKVTEGVTELRDRKIQCSKYVEDIYNLGLAKLIATKTLSAENIQFIKNMVKNMKIAFENEMNNNEWMEQRTRAESIKKVNNIKVKVGVQEKEFENHDLDAYYSKHQVNPDDFVTNLAQNKIQTKRAYLKNLQQPFKDWIWITSMTQVNAHYIKTANEIEIGNGLMQLPIFDPKAPGFYNYGTFGSFIGMLMTRAFALEGKSFDSNLNFKDWWPKQDEVLLNNQFQCFVTQYSQFQVNGIGNVNGELTKSANAADALSVKLAYRAYKEYMKTNTDAVPAGLNLTPEKLFFVATAQPWCFKRSFEFLKAWMQSQPFAPSRFRIIGRIQNSKDFADVFTCNVGDKMNPSKKCSLV